MLIGPPSPAFEPGDLGDRVAGDQAGVPVDLVDRRGDTTFGVSRQFRANSISAGVTSGARSPVGQ